MSTASILANLPGASVIRSPLRPMPRGDEIRPEEKPRPVFDAVNRASRGVREVRRPISEETRTTFPHSAWSLVFEAGSIPKSKGRLDRSSEALRPFQLHIPEPVTGLMGENKGKGGEREEEKDEPQISSRLMSLVSLQTMEPIVRRRGG